MEIGAYGQGTHNASQHAAMEFKKSTGIVPILPHQMAALLVMAVIQKQDPAMLNTVQSTADGRRGQHTLHAHKNVAVGPKPGQGSVRTHLPYTAGDIAKEGIQHH